VIASVRIFSSVARLAEIVAADRAERFELAAAPLMRFALVRLSGERHRLLVSNHHLLLDGWSAPLLVADLLRLYRLRGGKLEQLTVDHSEAVELAANAETAPTNVITRALGGHPEIDIAQLSFDVRGDDRFLLCSDGLHGELAPEAIAELMSGHDVADTSEALITRVLQGKAADNVTVVVVHAHAGADSADTLITEVR